MRRAAVAAGAHVLAAGEDETRHVVEGRVGVGGVENREDQRQQPRAADGRGVRRVHPDAERTADDLSGRRDGDGRQGRHDVAEVAGSRALPVS